ncbi:MAG: IS66 family insertion sequence element accessory protein TnpB, partial [Burkholderiales bacterium]
RILVAIEAFDFRNGIDGLATICKQQLNADPCSGSLFVFGNRRLTGRTRSSARACCRGKISPSG